MKKIIAALVSCGGLVLAAGCGGGADSAGPGPTPTAVSSSSTPTADPAPVELTRADIAPKVQAALRKQGTYRMTITNVVDPNDVVTATVRAGGAAEDFSLTSADASVIGVGGQYYYKDGPPSDKSAKWSKYNPKAKGVDALTNALITLYRFQVQAPRLLAAAPYTTSFASSPGPILEQQETRRYAMVIDLRKAAAAKVLGSLLTAEAAAREKTMPLEAMIDTHGLLRRLNYGTGTDATTVEFTNFGTKAAIAAPPRTS